ncbi:MAG: UDP-glucose--hexose-1-phosphate uridylyltransferase [Acidobacteria bacterium]|nr:UDP-glucose--hexose-1-phosphate uridylyltransferase [Acidobacteriota bacterium]
MLLQEAPHRRRNPLTGEWVLVSPQRMMRPWHGKVEPAAAGPVPRYDPDCYLCPGNLRAGGERNPEYGGTYAFTNDFPALLPEPRSPDVAPSRLLQYEEVRGTCRVICFSPRHDLTLPEMPEDDVLAVVELWLDEARRLAAGFRWVQIFENKGSLMGCSNPHPHGQVWAGSTLPGIPALEDRHQQAYLRDYGRPMLPDYLAAERNRGERIISGCDHWVALVPFWAVWPFETLLLPARHVPRITDLLPEERRSLASMLRLLLTKYDNLFEASFPYTMGWHGAPFDDSDPSHWQLHAHFFPPLLRSPSIRKFMVGYEMLGEPQRDLTPESAAARLRQAPPVHCRLRGPAGEPPRR